MSCKFVKAAELESRDVIFCQSIRPIQGALQTANQNSSYFAQRVVTGFAYFCVYPKFCGSNDNKFAIYNLIVGRIPLLMTGIIFWGSGVAFDLIFHHKLVQASNWTLDTLATYIAFATPLMLWCFKKHGVWESL